MFLSFRNFASTFLLDFGVLLFMLTGSQFEKVNLQEMLQIPDSLGSETVSNEVDFPVSAPPSRNAIGVGKHLAVLDCLQVFIFIVVVAMGFGNVLFTINDVTETQFAFPLFPPNLVHDPSYPFDKLYAN